MWGWWGWWPGTPGTAEYWSVLPGPAGPASGQGCHQWSPRLWLVAASPGRPLIGGQGPGSGGHQPSSSSRAHYRWGLEPARLPVTSPAPCHDPSVRNIPVTMSSWPSLGDDDRHRVTRLTRWPGSPRGSVTHNVWSVASSRARDIEQWMSCEERAECSVRLQPGSCGDFNFQTRGGEQSENGIRLGCSQCTLWSVECANTLNTRGSLCDTQWPSDGPEKSDKFLSPALMLCVLFSLANQLLKDGCVNYWTH